MVPPRDDLPAVQADLRRQPNARIRPREVFFCLEQKCRVDRPSEITGKKQGRTETQTTTHPNGRPPRGPDRELVGAVPVLSHLEPRPLLGAMPHAHQPGEEEQHQQPLARTDQPPTAFPAHASEVERHRSERARARVTRKATTTYQPSTAPLLALPPPQQSAGDESNGRGRHWNSSDVTARSLPSPTSPSPSRPSVPSLMSERKKESERLGPNLVTPTEAEQRKAAGLFFSFFLSRRAPPTTAATTTPGVPRTRSADHNTPARQRTARGSR